MSLSEWLDTYFNTSLFTHFLTLTAGLTVIGVCNQCEFYSPYEDKPGWGACLKRKSPDWHCGDGCKRFKALPYTAFLPIVDGEVQMPWR